ncbi:MAG: transposase [Cyanobacteriota/Melainabacteria group bacterium]
MLAANCNDAARLKNDSMHKLSVGIMLRDESPLASQPTLSAGENSVDEEAGLGALQKLLITAFIKQAKKRPKVLKLAIDTTCDEVHGHQQLSFYNESLRNRIATPPFCRRWLSLAALLRAGNAGRIAMELCECFSLWSMSFEDAVGRIELTADAAFAAPDIYNYCEQNHITYYIAIAGNTA